MKKYKLVLLTIWGCFALNFAAAQSAGSKLSGSVTDNNTPLDGAKVSLLAGKDSTVIKTTLTKADGRFVFENLKAGSYSLRITSVGYKNYLSHDISITAQEPVNLPAVHLSPSNTALKEVAVNGQKAYVEQKLDRTVVNVNALISNTGSNALEVLQKTPGVFVDADGNITFKGKSGVMLMIDDKPTYLSAANLATYLRSLPSSALDKIELMDNPPAKYDAAGSAGVINIKTKKNTIKGFNGTFTGSYAQGFYGRTRESLNLNYRVDKVNLFANVGYNSSRSYRRLEIDRHYFNADGSPNFSFKDVSIFRGTSTGYNAKAGLDYYLSPKTIWGIVFTGGLSNSHDDSPVFSTFYNISGAADSTISTQNISRSKFDNAGINLNYGHQFDTTGTALTFDLDYIRDVSGSNQTFINNTFTPDGALLASQTLKNDLPAYINIYAAKADFTMPLKDNGKFEAGVKSSYVNTDNAANYFNVLNGVSTVNYDNTNRFLYKENINAAYLNYNRNFGRFGVQTGLRMENTNGEGHQLGNAQRPDSLFINHYTNLFPTAYLSYKLDSAGHNMLVASYGRRIGRANYGQLNPFTDIVDKFTHFQGNPFLRPQFTYNYKLAYSYKSLLTVALMYNRIVDGQGETIYQDGNIFVGTPGNIGERKNWDLSVNFNLQPATWWTVNFYAETFYNAYSGLLHSSYINNSYTSYSGNANNQFTMGKGWSAELSGFYNSRSIFAQFKNIPNGMLNAGLQKKILQNKGTVKLNINDILQTFKPSGDINNITNTKASYHNTLDTRVTTLAFTYNFGKSINNPRRRATGSADSEQGRVK
ncbi:outer membrane beta-barrel protein [Mucilaginibacter sp. UR6-11]|uniref:outer membrane beta-barrel protein n=1 Tax=Mucilaginibacter sp. UR6-11 TaxID=1435644 RepID=UPI001E656B86|nr:outer membrane beta-barrel protein [Mucilaginibacter sp. UR6-11]MCC8424273.1 TonB-dependent receptor [Mucilaginibacter sp. UR6-11]